jgi:hypothetical protein
VDLAPELVEILMECSGPIPDFLESVKPADGSLVFNDDTISVTELTLQMNFFGIT